MIKTIKSYSTLRKNEPLFTFEYKIKMLMRKIVELAYQSHSSIQSVVGLYRPKENHGATLKKKRHASS